MKMILKCIWGIVISFSCFPTTEGENESERKEIKSTSKCVCYLEVLHERPRVLDSVVFLQMEHPQIQQRQTAVTMETKTLDGRWNLCTNCLQSSILNFIFMSSTQNTHGFQTHPTRPHGLGRTSVKLRMWEMYKTTWDRLYDDIKRHIIGCEL